MHTALAPALPPDFSRMSASPQHLYITRRQAKAAGGLPMCSGAPGVLKEVMAAQQTAWCKGQGLQRCLTC